MSDDNESAGWTLAAEFIRKRFSEPSSPRLYVFRVGGVLVGPSVVVRKSDGKRLYAVSISRAPECQKIGTLRTIREKELTEPTYLLYEDPEDARRALNGLVREEHAWSQKRFAAVLGDDLE